MLIHFNWLDCLKHWRVCDFLPYVYYATGSMLWKYNVDRTPTSYLETTMVLGVNKLFINDDAEVVAIGRLPNKGPSQAGDTIAAAVVCCVLGVACAAFMLWYYKFRPGVTGFKCDHPCSSRYTSIGASSSAAYASSYQPVGGTSSGAYGDL